MISMSIDGTNLMDDVEDTGKEMEEGAGGVSRYAGRRFKGYKNKRKEKRGKNNNESSSDGGEEGGSSDSTSNNRKNGPAKASGAGERGNRGVESEHSPTGTNKGGSGVNTEHKQGSSGAIEAAGKAGKKASDGISSLLKKFKKAKRIAIAVMIAIGLFILIFHRLSLDTPEVIIDKPYHTGFQIDDTIGEDGQSRTEYDAYDNTVKAIEMGIKIAQERAIKDFLKEVEKKGYDKEETLRASDLTGLLEVEYEPLIINAVYTTMMRQEGCTIQDICDILAENLEFKWEFGAEKDKEKTQLFEYRGLIFYRGFYAWEWRYDMYENPETGEIEERRWLEKVYIDNKEEVKYAGAVFEPLTREDFYAAFGYDDDKMGDDYYDEPYVLSITGWTWFDKMLDRALNLGFYVEHPSVETYFDNIVSIAETTEVYLFKTVGGIDADSYYAPGWRKAYLEPEELALLQGYVSDLANTVSKLDIVEVKDRDIYYNVAKKSMRALNDIPGQLDEEVKTAMNEMAAECVSIVDSWTVSSYINNEDCIKLRENLDTLREYGMGYKLKDNQKKSILKNTRKAIDLLLETIVSVSSEFLAEADAADAEREGRDKLSESLEHENNDCTPSG